MVQRSVIDATDGRQYHAKSRQCCAQQQLYDRLKTTVQFYYTT